MKATKLTAKEVLMIKTIAAALIGVAVIFSAAVAGPPWGVPGWNDPYPLPKDPCGPKPNCPDPNAPARPPEEKCYSNERHCTEWLSDGKCKLWETVRVQVSC